MFKMIFIVLLLLTGPFSSAGDTTEKVSGETPLSPNPAVQSFLKSLASTNLQERQNLFPKGTMEEVRQKLVDLQNTAGGPQQLVRQLMYFRLYAENMEEAMAAPYVMEQLGLSGEIIAEVALPLLESNNEAECRLASEWLTRADHKPQGGVDFSRYESILNGQKENPPKGLVRYMYGRNPPAAVVTLARVYGQQVVEPKIAGKTKAEIKESLNNFASRPEWWAHLYVAAMMEKEPYLRTPDLVKKLEQDTDPLVREKVTKLRQTMQAK